MGKISFRLLHHAPPENIAWLAGCVGADSGRLADLCRRENREIAVVYGEGCQFKLIAGAAAGSEIEVLIAVRGEGEYRPSALMLGSRSQFEQLASCLTAIEETLGGQISLSLGQGAPGKWAIGGGRELALDRTLIMGVLNLTPDSFYAGSRVGAVDEALRRAAAMAEEGADIIDLGGESTRPGAEEVPAAEEIARVVPVVKAVSTELGNIPVSIDTYKSDVAAAALDAGASIVNDIGAGLLDEAMPDVVAGAGAGYVMMHMRGKPRTMQSDTAYVDMMGEIHRFFVSGLERCESAGIEPERIVLDPGIGFGKPPEGNYEIIARLGEFGSLGRPLLIGASRKSFLALAGQDDPAERLEGSLAACVVAVLAGARIVRVHDVGPARRAVAAAGVFASKTGRI